MSPPVPPENPIVKIDQIKSAVFRVVHADGAWFSVSPQGYVHLTFYSERTPIAKQVTHELIGKQLGPEILDKRIGRDAYVREMEVDIVLSPQALVALHDWITEYMNKVKEAAAAMTATAAQQ
jgi:hypothetical protein